MAITSHSNLRLWSYAKQNLILSADKTKTKCQFEAPGQIQSSTLTIINFRVFEFAARLFRHHFHDFHEKNHFLLRREPNVLINISIFEYEILKANGTHLKNLQK